MKHICICDAVDSGIDSDEEEEYAGEVAEA